MRHAAWIVSAALSVAGPSAARPVAWTAYADCAAAYRVNARLADPDRPASMTAQISEVADDYAAAARARYLRQMKVSDRAARRAVAARVARKVGRLSSQPREAVEQIIEACPQTNG